jgi:transposase InsO family protein
MSLLQFRDHPLFYSNRWHEQRFALTQVVNITTKQQMRINDEAWLIKLQVFLDDQQINNINPLQLSNDIPDLLLGKGTSAIPKLGKISDPQDLHRGNVRLGQRLYGLNPTVKPPSTAFTAAAISQASSATSSSMKSLNTPYHSTGGNIRPPLGSVPHFNLGGTTIPPSSPAPRAGVYSSSNRQQQVILATDLPSLKILSSASLLKFINQCQLKGLDQQQIINQITPDMQSLISVKLDGYPMPNFSEADHNDWMNQIPIFEVLTHMKTLVAHGSQTNASIVQDALHEFAFTIDQNNEDSINAMSILIINTFVKELPVEIANDVTQQKIMTDRLMTILKNSDPPTFCTDLYNSIKSLGRQICTVKIFSTIFNQMACKLIRDIVKYKRYHSESPVDSRSSNHNKRHKGNKGDRQQSTSLNPNRDSKRDHCNGCGKTHHGKCDLSFKLEYNHDLKTPYSESSAGLAATARRQAAGQLPLKTLDTFYCPPGEPDPPVGSFIAKLYAEQLNKKAATSTSSSDGGRGRGGRSGASCNICNSLTTYLTSLNDKGECHLIPLQIKAAEEEDIKDVDAEEDIRLSPTSQRTAKDIKSSTHQSIDSQRLKQPFPVNTLLDTGSIGPDGNYIHKDIVSLLDPLNIHIKKSSNTVCSGMDNTCVANNSFLYITVMISKIIFITIKCYILNLTPFDLIIGRETIIKHHLVNRYPTYFGLEPGDTTPETEGASSDLTSKKSTKVKANIQNKKSTCCTGLIPCNKHGNFIAIGPCQPERSTISITSLSGNSKPLQALNLKRPLEPVAVIPHTLTAVQTLLEGHDGVPAESISNSGGRTGTVLERTYLVAGMIKTKEELLGPATTDDEEDDEISDLIDTFRYFTEKPSGENYLDLLTYGKDLELNREIRALCAEFPMIFSGTLPKEPARLEPFRIEVDRTKWAVNQSRLPPRTQTPVKNQEILKQVNELLELGIIEHSNASHYSQCILAPKPHTDKKEWRFCIDYRFLNSLTESLCWPLPNIKHMFERLGAQKAKYFAVMDFTQGFHQIAMNKASAVLTAFITFCGIYQFTRVPFGPKNAPSFYQQLIAGVVLAGILYFICELYIDDCIVFGTDKETFMKNLRTVFERFRDHGIVLKPKKCKFGLTEIEYVGRVINQHGTTMRNETITKVLEFPLPLFSKQLRGFIGLVNYFRDHVYGNHSEVVKPMHKLLEGIDNPTRKLEWTDEATQAFFKIKDLIAMQAELFFVNDTDPIYLLTDASDFGIGAYLYQLVDGKERPIYFVSKSLTGAQLRWSTPQKEAYAFYYSITGPLSYLLRDRKFHLKTDHRNLTYVADSINAMVVRWKIALMQYDFDIEHIAGVLNIVADYLSRLVQNHMLQNKQYNQQLVLSAGFTGYLIPDEAYDKIIRVHNSLAGHAGVDRCLKRLADTNQAWKYMREHVRAFIKLCACCQKMSVLKIPIHGHPFTTSTYQPMVRLNIDFIGPFPDGGYILTIIDTFTRWVELFICEHANAQEAARCLFEHFGRFGAPSQIQSDRGSHFVNHLIAEFLAYMGTEHCLSIAYSKQENSLVERTNKEINRHTTSLFFDRLIQDDWRNAKPIVHRILNSTYSERTKISPADMLFGRAVDLDRGIYASFEETTLSSPVPLSTTTSKMLKLQSDLMRIHRQILTDTDKSRLENTDDEFTEFTNGTYVLLEPVTGPKGRLHTRRTEPYIIISSSNNNYTLENLVSKRQLRVHINRIVPFLFDPKKTDPQKVAAHDADEFHIEMITSHRGRFSNKRNLEFKVKWTGFDESYDTWEPWKNLKDVEQLHDYLRLLNLAHEIPRDHQH